MKLIKFIAAAALVASTSLLSGGNNASVGAMHEIAGGVCPNWPHCRVDNIADQTTDLQQQMKTAVVLKAA